MKSEAEGRFAKLKKQTAKVPNEREKAERKKAENVARLRALRLAKEASDKEAAENAAGGGKPRAKQSASALRKSLTERQAATRSHGEIAGSRHPDAPLKRRFGRE